MEKQKALKTFLILIGSVLGLAIPLVFFTNKDIPQRFNTKIPIQNVNGPLVQKEVVGFLPFWLVKYAKEDYSPYISTLTYFNLTIGPDGKIIKANEKREADPGWHTLQKEAVVDRLKKALNKNMKLSLAVFSNDDDNINIMIQNPQSSARNLTSDVKPIMEKYGFSDLNLDVEQVREASPSARKNFSEFVREISKELKSENTHTLSIDVSASAFVKETNLVDPLEIAPFVDKVIIMAYDYHYPGSYVTGPVAPLYGAGTVSEFDAETAVLKALEIIPPEKIILGAPLYGYEWEAAGNFPRAAVMPGSGTTISNRRAEETLIRCQTECVGRFDETDKESYLIYKDEKVNIYHHVFYPDAKSMQAKVNYARNLNLGGLALWALGYEGESILEPLRAYYR